PPERKGPGTSQGRAGYRRQLFKMITTSFTWTVKAFCCTIDQRCYVRATSAEQGSLIFYFYFNPVSCISQSLLRRSISHSIHSTHRAFSPSLSLSLSLSFSTCLVSIFHTFSPSPSLLLPFSLSFFFLS